MSIRLFPGPELQEKIQDVKRALTTHGVDWQVDRTLATK